MDLNEFKEKLAKKTDINEIDYLLTDSLAVLSPEDKKAAKTLCNDKILNLCNNISILIEEKYKKN